MKTNNEDIEFTIYIFTTIMTYTQRSECRLLIELVKNVGAEIISNNKD